MDPITCLCCGLFILLILGAGSGRTQTTKTVIMTPAGPQTMTSKTTRSMGIGDLIIWAIVAFFLIPIIAGVIYVWANS